MLEYEQHKVVEQANTCSSTEATKEQDKGDTKPSQKLAAECH